MPPPAATVAVTGAGGYVGGRLVTSWSGPGTVRALVRRRSDHLAADDQHELDLTAGGPALARALDGVGAVVHLAGHNEVVAAEDPDRALAETLAATRQLIDAARAAGVTRVVYVSTVHVYGEHLVAGARVTEDVDPAPTSVYAQARLGCEQLLLDAGLDPVVLRLTNAVGAPADAAVDRWSLVAADLCRQAATTGRLRLRTSGHQHRDFVHLGDVCRIVAAAADPATVVGGVYNLGSGQPLTIRDLAELVRDVVAELTGTRPPLDAPPGEPSDAPYTVDVDRLADQGQRAATPIRDAVTELARFCLDHRDRW
ncbi:SDR family oxidoreductase [Nitriliruptoraceae bacterium ZYF776]|nr:SDR family oxidoreductase [Profundirhabdus halotolerans]